MASLAGGGGGGVGEGGIGRVVMATAKELGGWS